MDIHNFNAIISHMLSHENAERESAEKRFEEMDLAIKTDFLYRLYSEKSADPSV